MTFPDYWTAISGSFTDFMEWTTVTNLLGVVVGVAVGAVVLGMFLKVVFR